MSNKLLLEKIKKARLIKGLKQEDIAKKLNISPPTYSRFERGITKADFALIKKVFSMLDLNFYDLEPDKVELLNEQDIPSYDKSNTTTSDQLKTVIKLLEKQHQINAELLRKYKSLAAQQK